MPIISSVNARSWKGKTLYVGITSVLILGAVTMIYPFLLMLSGSLHSEADANEINIIPGFWKDDVVLYRKYVESKYGEPVILQKAWGARPAGFRRIEPPVPGKPEYLEDYLAWREEAPWWELGHVRTGRLLGRNAREFRNQLYDRFDGDLFKFREIFKIPVKDWAQVLPARPAVTRYTPPRSDFIDEWYAFAETKPLVDRYVIDPDAIFVGNFLIATYTTDIERYNEAHGTDYASYDEVVLATRVDGLEGLERTDWEEYVRKELWLQFIRLDASLAGAYQTFLRTVQYADIEEYNSRFGTTHTSFDEILFSETQPDHPIVKSDWEKFLKDKETCPSGSIEIHGSRQIFEAFVAKRRNLPVEEVGPIRLPAAAADYHDLNQSKKEWRREFTRQNYAHVIDYVGRHGNGIKNTLIYCMLAIGTALFVNPLAAYALSRYKPPSMYKILLFCMATMAFPAEVTMIPGFLLLKRFPAMPLIVGFATFMAVCWILNRTAKGWPETLRLTSALAVGIVVGAWLLPAVTGKAHVSLLNTFWALVLPGAANGFFIFLLKGFFDSLPQELFEQAEIDGAGEWTKFWSITMYLSQPILAVIALNAFVGAYSAFMMALIIIPDQDMWTLMVWIFQLQSIAHPGVVYASIVITAIPTFLVFAFCQNIIIRGIVVPVEK
jgi:multiple sugar transport system permease protein